MVGKDEAPQDPIAKAITRLATAIEKLASAYLSMAQDDDDDQEFEPKPQTLDA